MPTQDIVLGLYYLTRERIGVAGEGKVFSCFDEVRAAYDTAMVHLQAKIKVKHDGKMYDTTIGRVLLMEVIPEVIVFDEVNMVMDKKRLADLIDTCYRRGGNKKTVILADKLKDMGYKYASKAGISICVDDMKIPAKKEELLQGAYGMVNEIQAQYNEGLITDGERYNKVIDIWAQATEEIADEMLKELGSDIIKDENNKDKKVLSFNPIFIMADSGSRGSAQQIRQLAGMRGLMAKPSGEIIETPITANFREGLTVLAVLHLDPRRKKRSRRYRAQDGQLRLPYTRRLVDVAQDAIITEDDCGTLDGIYMISLVEGGEVIEAIGERILGRVALEDVYRSVQPGYPRSLQRRDR